MKIIECPRDAMQGVETFIPTASKIAYINQLLKVGFAEIDFGSFVSPRHVPQMRDTAEVVAGLEWQASRSKLLAIVANLRGAKEACAFEAISRIGYPMSISETFQKRNTNKSISDSLNELEQIGEVVAASGKDLVVYISMGFGNPYGDPYDRDIVLQFTGILVAMGAAVVSLADTVGKADEKQVTDLFSALARDYPTVEIGAHLHSKPSTAAAKVEAAFRAGCKRFDGALMGYGGCPMADDKLVGNVATETIISVLEQNGVETGLDKGQLATALLMVPEIFPKR
ncbi:MAG: hydroxymethylglutaryl-CoA lyase [Cyclobacteriaceae bacterium]|jgi:hydroxymethylglutaryl-CoA lyase|nr:hydroxymethylglutaryl-CoA lyase [Cyclobacteriaceae bacterium]